MDFSRWSEIHPKQHLPTIPQHHTESYAHLYDAPQQSYAPHNPHHPPNPNPGLLNAPDIQHLISKYENPTPPTQFKPNAPDVGLRPPGIDPYTLNSYAPHAGFEGQGLVVPPPYAHHPQPLMPVGPAAASYYQDPSVQQNWAAKEAIRQFGANPLGYAAAIRPPNGMEQMVATNPNPMFWNRQSVHPSTNGAWKRGPKKTKVVQSAWCEVCKIDCNSQDVLNKHKSGKKHKKNMEKLQESKNAAATAAPAPTPAPAPAPAPITTTAKPKKSVAGKKRVFSSGEKQKSAAGQVRKGAPPSEPGEDLETKKRKLMEGGAPVDSVRVCEVCNVACNSQTVFNYHLAGQKHAAQVKKQAETAAAAARGIVAAGPSAVTSA
ncbi:uncharacterized protein LOC131229655 [Magnolia sinica]|uniref:uncharacterized protein LOC131229655 n=1 Tax=Magnolia sinica TaxID=86752 RepID=UPI00265B3A9E|nr:uncharacterized protein LOC131229655 [Magnolia sinica]